MLQKISLIIVTERFTHGAKSLKCPSYSTLQVDSQMEIMETIRDQVENNAVLLYMKGSPNQPQCGFSARTVQSLMECGHRFAYVDILSNPEIRANLPAFANWPTFPQLWVSGELIGGCDIVTEMHEKGELKQLIDDSLADTSS